MKKFVNVILLLFLFIMIGVTIYFGVQDFATRAVLNEKKILSKVMTRQLKKKIKRYNQ